MILIDRSKTRSPRALSADGPKHLRDVIEPLVRQGTLTSRSFDRSIYASEEVRQRLWNMQHQKCCFCECEYEIKHATVEHFRPKSEASDDIRNRGNKRVGYWWLAYTFENLYFCCKNCNTPKATYFPLAPGARPLAPGALPSGSNEQAQLLDPGGPVDPETVIAWQWNRRFKSYVPTGKTMLGRNTIRAAELDQRDTLNKLRAKHYKRHVAPVLKRYFEAKKTGDRSLIADAVQDAKRLSESSAPYAGMTRFVFRKKGLL